MIREAFQLIYSMNLHLPTRFLLLDRAIATLGSVGVELYSDFNVFEVARPYARDLMLERFTPQRIARRARRDALRYAQIVAEAPLQFHDFMEEIRDGQIEVGFVHKGLDDFLDNMQKVFNRLVIALIVTGGLIGSSLIGIFAKGGPHILGVNVISVGGFALSSVLGIWLLWGVVRSGRLSDRASGGRRPRSGRWPAARGVPDCSGAASRSSSSGLSPTPRRRRPGGCAPGA